MATLQDVAKRAGVSTATVSKVLSNTPYFSESTGQRVLKAAADLGYRPNLAARALSSGKTGIIAVAFPYLYDPIFRDPRILQTLEGLEQVLVTAGYHILLSTPYPTENGMDEQFGTLMASGYLEGIIAFDNAPVASVQDAIPDGIPGVMMGYHESPCSVQSDDYAGGCALATHLIEMGHRRIGIITVAEQQHLAIDERMRGILDTVDAAGIARADLAIVYGDFSATSGAEAIPALLEKNPAMTAIIGINDRMALGAIQALQSRGIRVPDAMSVVGYDNIPMSSMSSPALTTVDQRSTEIGHRAATQLLQILKGDIVDSCVVMPRLIIRESTARLGA